MAKKKEPAKAGDISNLIGAVRALVAHLESRSWLAALADLQAVWKEVMAGFAVPVLATADGKDCCCDEEVQKLCKQLEDCCDEIKECDDPDHDHKKPAKADFPLGAGGMWLKLLAPLLLKALEAILGGMTKEAKE